MLLPQRECTARRPRRNSESSMMSSWTSVAVWMNSITDAYITAISPVESPARRAAINITAGRTRLPPLCCRYRPSSGMSSTRASM